MVGTNGVGGAEEGGGTEETPTEAEAGGDTEDESTTGGEEEEEEEEEEGERDAAGAPDTATSLVIEKTDRDEAGEDLEDQMSHPYVRRKLYLSAQLIAAVRPGNVKVDATKLAEALGYSSADKAMLGIVAKVRPSKASI